MTTTVTPPREGHEQINNTPWLARMLDKARLQAAGTIDQFDLDYPCPMDQQLLGKLGLDSATFQKIAVENTTDDAVVAAMKAENAIF